MTTHAIPVDQLTVLIIAPPIATGPNELSIRDPSAAMAILGTSGLPKGTGKHPAA